MKVNLRRMQRADVPRALELSTLANWNQTEADWRRYMHLEAEGCFVAEADGTVCGTVTSIDYERRFAWIGMVVVHPDQRGQGIGTALVLRAIEYLRSIGTETIKLDATPQGKPIYEKLAFKEESVGQRWAGTASGSGEHLERASRADMADIIALDTAAFGAERRRVIERLFEENPARTEIVRNPKGQLLGYASTRPGRKAWYFGPCVTRDSDTGFRLFTSAMGRLVGQPMYVDIVTSSAEVRRRLADYGFTHQRSLTRMYLGPNTAVGKPEWTFAVAGFEKG